MNQRPLDFPESKVDKLAAGFPENNPLETIPTF